MADIRQEAKRDALKARLDAVTALSAITNPDKKVDDELLEVTASIKNDIDKLAFSGFGLDVVDMLIVQLEHTVAHTAELGKKIDDIEAKMKEG